MVGEVAVGLPVIRRQVEAELGEDRPAHRAGHAVPAVAYDAQRLDRARVDELQDLLAIAGEDVDLLGGPAAGRVAQALLDQPADVLDPAVAGQRERAALDQLRAGVGLRVVRGGAHEPAVEVARADQVVEHLGPDLAGVEDVRALGDHALAVAARQLGCGEAHVAPEAQPELGRGPAGEGRDDADEGLPDRFGDVAVDLLAVEATDVVGLEDLGWRSGRHGGGSYAAGRRMRILTVGNMYPPHHLGGYELQWQGTNRRARSAATRSRCSRPAIASLEPTRPLRRTASTGPCAGTGTTTPFPKLPIRRRLALERHNHAVLARRIDEDRPTSSPGGRWAACRSRWSRRSGGGGSHPCCWCATTG